MIKLLYFFYFFSGLTALIYEIIWARRLGLIFGVDAYGIATVLTVFFTGLALGSFLFGKLIDQRNADKRRFWPISTDSVKSALILYGALELSIGLYAALTPLIFKYVTNLQVFLFDALGNPQFFSFSLIVFLMSILVLIVPTTLMGATFPVIVKAIHANIRINSQNLNSHSISMSVGLLYGFNTLGAVTGTLLAGFLLIWLIGTNLTTYLVALINLLIGASVLYLSIRLAQSRIQTNEKTQMDVNRRMRDIRINSHNLHSHSISILIVFFLTGFAALALEVLWTRVLIVTFGTSTYAFATVLATFLLGIALGSLVATRFVSKNAEVLFAASLASLGLLVVILTIVLGNLPALMLNFFTPTNTSYWQNLTASAVLTSLTIFLPTFLMGINFVIGLKIYLADSKTVASDTGRLYAVNTVGGVLGAFVAGFILLPLVGAQRGIAATALIYVLAAAQVSFGLISHQRYLRYGTVGIAIVVLVLGLLLPSWNKHILNSGVAVYYQDLLQRPKAEFVKTVSGGEILYYKEGVLATVMVKRAPEGFLFLRSNGKTDASTDQDLDDFRLQGHLPLILHKSPLKALSIGIGSGITSGSMATHNISLDVVEIEPAMVKAPEYFAQYNHNVLENPKVKVILADARAYLAGKQNYYDVIASQPSNPWVRGNTNLYTSEFFQIAKDALAEDGLMMQWVQFYSFDKKAFLSVLKTFASVFPHVTVWTPVASHDILLIGTKTPQKFDYARIDNLVKSDTVQRDLKSAAITQAEDLLAHYLFDEKTLTELTGEVSPITDDKPTIEFTSPFSLNRQTLIENLTTLLSAKGRYTDHFQNLEKADTTKIEKAQEAIRLILEAKIKAQSGQLATSTADFEKALEVLPKELVKKELSRIYFELARQASEVNDIAKMTTYFEKSVASYPNANVYLNLAIVYLSQNRIARATEALEGAKSLQPQNPRIQEVEKAINDKKYK